RRHTRSYGDWSSDVCSSDLTRLLSCAPIAQFRAMGAQLKSRVAAFEESLSALRRLFAGETVTASGIFSFDSARLALKPAEPVDVWIGATAAPAIDRAARLGDAWLASPGLTPHVAREKIAYYRHRCQAHGRAPSA